MIAPSPDQHNEAAAMTESVKRALGELQFQILALGAQATSREARIAALDAENAALRTAVRNQSDAQ